MVETLAHRRATTHRGRTFRSMTTIHGVHKSCINDSKLCPNQIVSYGSCRGSLDAPPPSHSSNEPASWNSPCTSALPTSEHTDYSIQSAKRLRRYTNAMQLLVGLTHQWLCDCETISEVTSDDDRLWLPRAGHCSLGAASAIRCHSDRHNAFHVVTLTRLGRSFS